MKIKLALIIGNLMFVIRIDKIKVFNVLRYTIGTVKQLPWYSC